MLNSILESLYAWHVNIIFAIVFDIVIVLVAIVLEHVLIRSSYPIGDNIADDLDKLDIATHEKAKEAATKDVAVQKKKQLSVIIGIWACRVCIFLGAIILILQVATTASAFHKGIPSDIWYKLNVSDIQQGQATSFDTDTPPTSDEQKGSIVVFTKFGCPDCAAIRPDLLNMISNKKHIYIVSSQSDYGKKYAKECDFRTVPTAVYFYRHTQPNGAKYAQYPLDLHKNYKVTLDKEAFKQLLALQERKQ